MALDRRENLMKYAEETAYSSKGHFKTADFAKISLRLYITIPIVLSIILIVYVSMPQWASRFLSCMSIIFSFLALTSPMVSNQDRAHKIIEDHMSLGNAYLELHKEIRNIASGEPVTSEQLDGVAKKISELDRRSKDLRIGFIGRLWSRCRINKEMDLDWIKAK